MDQVGGTKEDCQAYSALQDNEGPIRGTCLMYPSDMTPYVATCAHHPLKLKYIYSRTDIHKNSFLPRSICTWNNLNILNIATISLADFKKELISLSTAVLYSRD